MRTTVCLFLATALHLAAGASAWPAFAIEPPARVSAVSSASAVIPFDSPIYFYLEKLSGLGLISRDVRHSKPFSAAEAARLVLEAEANIAAQESAEPAWSKSLLRFIPPRPPDTTMLNIGRDLSARTRELLPPDSFLKENLEKRTAADGYPVGRTISSANIPLSSPLYGYLEKLAGMGLITSDVKGLRPYSKVEVARLLLEAARNSAARDSAAPAYAQELMKRIREYVPREVFLRENPDKAAPLFDYNPVSSLRMSYVYLDGVPRNYRRPGAVSARSAFGFIGGRLTNSGVLYASGSEGTPLVDNNNGFNYRDGSNGELRWGGEAYLGDMVTGFLEPVASYSKSTSDTEVKLNRGYIKLGGGGLELEAGRDENWFGPGYRGALTLTGNAQNFDQIKLSSPEPLDVAWVKRWLGEVKYALIFSRFDETDVGTPDHRQPYFIGIKLALKPYDWFEYGFNFVRQEGGPGFSGNTSIQDFIFGGGYSNKSNSIAGFDLRFRIPWLRNTEVYGEFVGEDSATFWPVDESYIAGIHVPCLTPSCRDDLRFEFFWGSPRLYTDGKFNRGYTYHGMSPGHSQGGGSSQDFYVRYSHSFSVRNQVALEYFHTDRGQEGRVLVDSAGRYDPVNGTPQAMEHKDAGRISWQLPIRGDVDGKLLYGIERVTNMNLVEGVDRTNQLVMFELSYRY